jgi:DNA-binding NarL/FixJ family response regulator
VEPVEVAVLSHHPALAVGLLPGLTAIPGLRVVPEAAARSADVLLALASTVTDDVLDELELAAAAAEKRGHCVVLVSDPLQERHLARALAAGVVGMLTRLQANAQVVHHTIIAGHEGRSMLPDSVVRWLADDFRMLRENTFEPPVQHHDGLADREVEVLKLIAEGASTATIAARMSYSQRTVKKIIQDLLTRLELENRAHAVSYAIRIGAI